MTFLPASSGFIHPGPMAMQQHPNYASTVEALGGRAKAYDCRDNDMLIARIQVIQRSIGPFKLAWVPRGPAWSQNISKQHKREVLSRLRCSLPKGSLQLITPDSTEDTTLLADMNLREISGAQHFATLDLTPPKAQRLAMQHGKWRNRLRFAQNTPTIVQHRPFHPEHDFDLLKLELQQRRKLGYRALPPSFTQAWASVTRKGAHLFTAHDHTGLIAFVLVLVHAPSATYHLGWSNTRGRQMSCHNQLLWHAANWLVDREITTLDMGLIDTERAPGLARFKLGIGAQIHRTGPTMLVLPRLRLPRVLRRAA